MGTGTGFFFDFDESNDKENEKLVILTNKHVIKGALKGKLIFTKCDHDDNPLDDEHLIIELDNFESLWVMHPNDEIDLCALPLDTMIENSLNERIYYASFGKEHLPDQQEIDSFPSIEDILMIGYPNGIWDNKNNKPIIRKGITATSFRLDYSGRKEFLIDAACFPGSSGSPVVLFNRGEYFDKNGEKYIIKHRIFILGILYAGPQYTIRGEVKVVKIPTGLKTIADSKIPNNLGFVIKSEKILDLEKHVDQKVNNNS